MKLYLDSKPKVVDIAGKPHIFQFAKGLKFVVINGHPFKTDFGGHSMTVYVNNREHFLRLTALPPGVMPAEVSDTKGSDLPEKDKELKTSGDMQNFFSKLAKAGLVTTPAREKLDAEKLNHQPPSEKLAASVTGFNEPQPPSENVAAPVTGFNEPQVETSDHFRVSGGAN